MEGISDTLRVNTNNDMDDQPVGDTEDILGPLPPVRPKLKRVGSSQVSFVTDLETGSPRGVRSQEALIREHSHAAQDRGTRRRKKIERKMTQVMNPFFSNGRKPQEEEEEEEANDIKDDSEENENMKSANLRPSMSKRESMNGRFFVEELLPATLFEEDTTQYRLKSARKVKKKMQEHIDHAWDEDKEKNYQNWFEIAGIKPNAILVNYFNWTFRANTFKVFCSGMLAFYGCTLIFALIFYWAGNSNPDCIHVNGRAFAVNSTSTQDFMDAYALSWTTFSTVGYGLVYPSTSATVENNVRQCTVVTLFATLESFIGMLFASCCLAIIVSKVTRNQSFAQVQFSDPMLIRYGQGLLLPEDQEEDDESNLLLVSPDKGPKHLPCPKLEFRIMNKLHNVSSGEIIEGAVNIIANVSEEQYEAYQQSSALSSGKSLRRRRKKKRVKTATLHRGISLGDDDDDGGFVGPNSPDKQRMESLRSDMISSMMSRRDYRRRVESMEEDKSRDVKYTGFVKVEFDPIEHPYFKRMWTLTHALDVNSPLLKTQAKELLELNNGHWPEYMNNAEGIRASIAFDQIIVKLSGTSNVDANTVHNHKIYRFDDICVGWSFVSCLFRHHDDGPLYVDEHRLNLVVEQNGGGGEDLGDWFGDDVKWRDSTNIMASL